MEQETLLTERGTTVRIIPAVAQEQPLCFSDPEALEENACIGHLRGDYGRNGAEFHTSWWPHQNALKTEEFMFEFDDVVNALRKVKLLGGFDQMRHTCQRYPESRIHSQYREEYAFRVETKEQTYFLRCIPQRGDYNFYLYAYKSDSLRELYRANSGLPQRCWTTLKTSGEAVELRYGHKGYYPVAQVNERVMSGKDIADGLNQKFGVSKAQIAAMEAGSKFGWHTQAARAKSYDENGLPIKPKPHEQER